ncbi:MAG: glycoside hydrolase family 9 protein [Bacteroidota bacterium]
MKRRYILILIIFISTQLIIAQSKIKHLKQADYKNSLQYIWDNKEVFDSKTIDNCESLTNWQFGGLASMILCDTIVEEGKSSIKLSFPVEYSDGREYPIAYIENMVKGENWEDYNRISTSIYVKHESAKFIYLSLELKNKGVEKVPNRFKKNGRHYFKAETNKWNRVLWEIPAIPRDKVTGLAVVYLIKGKALKNSGDSITVFADNFELQKVKPNYEEGWQVENGKVAFSHNGYLCGSEKIALTNGIEANEFSIVNSETKQVVFTNKIEVNKTRFGDFQKLNFSEFKEEGEYQISIGNILTRPFHISNNIWERSIWNNLNFWKAERCGEAVNGIHDKCHQDVFAVHGTDTIFVNGGWHDAGDLTQMIYNTGDAIVTMLEFAEKVESKNEELYNALVDEAKWGLEWMLKTRFGKGYRHTFGGISKYTDGIIGTNDDIKFEAKKLTYENFLSAMVISNASLFFEKRDEELFNKCKVAAIEDWRFASEGITELNVELCGNATIASINLFKLTNDSLYLNKAIEWADVLIQSQQQDYTDWEIPLNGFFYKSPKHEQILRYNPIGNDQAPIIALNNLCKLLPNHPNWIEWYTAIALYAEYIKETAKISNPFEMIPQSIYNVDEIHKPSIYGLQQSTLAKYKKYEEKEPQYKEQVKSGLPLGKGNYLRTFPVWYSHRGSAGIQMAQAKGLAVASNLRNDMEGLNLATKQLEWIVGRNPFAQSTIYGEGYDFPPMYFASSGTIVGAIACGIQTHGNSDVPNWPASACWNYKEIWTHTTSRYLWLISEVAYSHNPISDSDESNNVLTSKRIVGDGLYQIQISFSKDNERKYELLGYNIIVNKPYKTIQPDENNKLVISWEVKVVSNNKPWVAVVKSNDEIIEIE